MICYHLIVLQEVKLTIYTALESVKTQSLSLMSHYPDCPEEFQSTVYGGNMSALYANFECDGCGSKEDLNIHSYNDMDYLPFCRSCEVVIDLEMQVAQLKKSLQKSKNISRRNLATYLKKQRTRTVILMAERPNLEVVDMDISEDEEEEEDVQQVLNVWMELEKIRR